MKKRNTVLALAALTAITAGVAATSTLAWFTTSRNASVSFNSINVITSTGKLSVAYGALDGSSNTNSSETTDSGFSVKSTVSNALDISGSGIDFFKKTKGDANWTKFCLTGATNVYTSGSVELYYTEFTITVSRNSGSNPFKVYLGDGTTIAPVDDTKPADVAAAEGTRVAIYSGSTVREGFQSKAGTDEPYRYVKVKSDAQITPATILTDTYSSVWGSATASASDIYKRATWTYQTANTPATAKSNPIALLTGTTLAETVTLRMWLDGTCVSTNEDAIGGQVKLTLNLYGLDA